MSSNDQAEVIDSAQDALRATLRGRGRQLAIIFAVLYVVLLLAVIAAAVWASLAVRHMPVLDMA